MADLRKVPVVWTTGPGGAGVSVFYSADPDDATVALGTFFNAIKNFFNPVVTWAIPSSGDKVDVDSGHLTGTWTGGTAATISGINNTNYAAGTGGMVQWRTSLITAGHRKLVGRTFLNPFVLSMYDGSGTIDNTNLATLQAAVNALAASGKLVIWHRPKKGTFSGGVASTVVSGNALDQVHSLRSRRT